MELLPFPLVNDNDSCIKDVNSYIGHAESLVHNAQCDSLSDDFRSLLEYHHLSDIPMALLQPTWRNKRTGDATLASSLDRFFFNDSLLDHLSLYCQWVGLGGLSSHLPIYLEFASGDRKPKAPYKFNSTWLKDKGYLQMVTNHWKTYSPSHGQSVFEVFAKKL